MSNSPLEIDSTTDLSTQGHLEVVDGRQVGLTLRDP